jgi:hypothetical protein
MNFNQILERATVLQNKVDDELNKLCESRVRSLVNKLANFTFTRIIMGMGYYTFEGEKFTAIYEDGSTADMPLSGLIDYSDRCFWKPETITTIEFVALQELNDLCNWWVQATGGKDVVFLKGRGRLSTCVPLTDKQWKKLEFWDLNDERLKFIKALENVGAFNVDWNSQYIFFDADSQTQIEIVVRKIEELLSREGCWGISIEI